VHVSRLARVLTIASSDSGGGAGIQADLRAIAACGGHGSSVVVALTAQNTREVSAVHEVPPHFVVAQLRAVFDDIGVDAAKTGMLFSRPTIEAVARFLRDRAVPLVVDPVMVASSGATLLRADAVAAMVEQLFPLATVITPNLLEARTLTGAQGSRSELAERLHAMGAAAVIVTGGHGGEPVDHLYDGRHHTEIAVPRHDIAATHGAGCTHSATLATSLAQGWTLIDAARRAAAVAAGAVARGLTEIGAGDGPVDVLDIRSRVPPQPVPLASGAPR
jgi:hydroxymethylpyrimidine/phosphomethylpyrimidine kinase